MLPVAVGLCSVLLTWAVVAFCRILGSCTSLMQAIQVLIVASKELQREIVESGRVSVGRGPGQSGHWLPIPSSLRS